MIDYLSACQPRTLYISSQTHPGPELVLANRASPGILPPGHLKDLELTGWHPTRPLLEAMIRWGGFGNVQSMTSEPFNFPQKPTGATNSAYYRAELVQAADPEGERRRFYPR